MFRFEKLEIWQEAIEITEELFEIADISEKRKLYRFSEQLRGAGMSISNNIAEGSGSFSDKEFAFFLNMSRRSLFECVNILTIYHRRNLITMERKNRLCAQLEVLSKKITMFRRSLGRRAESVERRAKGVELRAKS